MAKHPIFIVVDSCFGQLNLNGGSKMKKATPAAIFIFVLSDYGNIRKILVLLSSAFSFVFVMSC